MKLAGTVRFEDVLDYAESRLKYAKQTSIAGSDTLVDLRFLENTFTYDQVTRLTEQMQQPAWSWAERRVAMLVSKEAHYGVGRMFSMVLTARTNANVSVFRRVEDVTEWLSRPVATILDGLSETDWQGVAAAE